MTVSKNLWTPRSPDLTTCNYFLWGHLESMVYESNLHTIQELKDISHTVAAIKITILYRVYLNMIRRVQLCIDAGGNHFQHLLCWFNLSAFGYYINFCIYAMDLGYFFVAHSIRLTEITYWRYQNFVLFVQISVSCLSVVFASSSHYFSLLLWLIHRQLQLLSYVKEGHEEFDFSTFMDKISWCSRFWWYLMRCLNNIISLFMF